MRKIKLFEEFNTNENVLKSDVPRIDSFVAKLIAKVKDAKLVKDIKNFVSMHEIDPYPYTFETFIKDIKDHFSSEVDFSGITESILLEGDFEGISNQSAWGQIGPNWLFDYVMNKPGSAITGSGNNQAIFMEHGDLDISVIFFLFENSIRWTWTWGSEEKDIQSMINSETKEHITADFKITGNTPKEFVENVIKKISQEEESQRNSEVDKLNNHK